MICQTCQDRLADFVSGEMPLDDEAAAHLNDCVGCASEFSAMQEAYHALAFTVPVIEVRAAVKTQLMARLDADQASPPGRMRLAGSATQPVPEHWLSRGFKLFVTSAVAAGVAVVVTHAVMMRRVRDVQQVDENIRTALVFSENQNVVLQEDIKRHSGDLQVLQAADLRLVNLQAEPNQPGGACRLFFANGVNGGYFVVRDAPPPPAGRTYELWLIDGKSSKTPAGTFNVGPDGSARVPVKFDAAVASGATVVAVTDEPAGGSPHPTGEIRFAGKVVQ